MPPLAGRPGWAESEARVAGRFELPGGLSAEDVLAKPASERLAVLEFHARATRLLGVSAGRVFIQKKPAATDLERARRGPGHWHRDSFTGPGLVATVIGEIPTEFLLGAYDERDLEDRARHPRLEATMRPWQPRPCELVWFDRWTVHRRPQLVTGRRLYLLASVDQSVLTAGRARAGT